MCHSSVLPVTTRQERELLLMYPGKEELVKNMIKDKKQKGLAEPDPEAI
jgi:hypothetical protein